MNKKCEIFLEPLIKAKQPFVFRFTDNRQACGSIHLHFYSLFKLIFANKNKSFILDGMRDEILKN